MIQYVVCPIKVFCQWPYALFKLPVIDVRYLGVRYAAEGFCLFEHGLHDGEHALGVRLLGQLHQQPHRVHHVSAHLPKTISIGLEWL